MATQAPYKRQADVVQHLQALLDEIRSQKREPDKWEATHIAQALGLLSAHWYDAALAMAAKAAEPATHTEGERARDSDTPTLRTLDEAMLFIAAQPALNRF